tara:strand:- start:21748 stop:23760 length:2013 start_codon:yes stop_codon:yes gene_type:complete
LTQAQPVLSLVRPLRADEPKSIDFMLADLARSGLVPEDLGAYPIALQALSTVAAYIIPYSNPRMYRMRLDRATDKYTQPKGLREVWSSPHQDTKLFRNEPILYIIEGEKKAAKFVKTWPGLPTFGIGGAHNALIKLPDGSRRLLDDLLAAMRPGMRVVTIFDGDILTKPGIQQAAHNLNFAVTQLGCTFEVFCPPLGKGVDDWLVADSDARLADLTHIPLKDLEESRKQLFQQLGIQMNEKGTPILNELNASKILIHRFTETSFVDKRLGLVNNGEVKDFQALEYEAVEYVQGELLAHMPVAKIRYGLHNALAVTRRDLLQEMFRKLTWDGVKRLDTWAAEYFDTTFPAYTKEWGRLLLTGLTLRVLEPGTKVDRACILVGAQGIGKSTFFEELATFDGYSFYHACTELSSDAGDGNRTQGAAFAKSVIVDLAEGVIFETKKIAMDRAKQRITQTHDEYREVYATSTRVEKRGFVFVGTTNRSDQLGDHTGSRRFLPITALSIKRLPYEKKMQIIAEVVAQEHELRQSAWYDLRLSVADAPESLRSEHGHIQDVQTLVNTQFSRPDMLGEFIKDLLDAGEPARLKDNMNAMYITAGYISARAGNAMDFGGRGMIARILSSLSTSTTFPYRLESIRKRLPQLAIPQEMLAMYTSGISNGQQMINGFVVTRK